MILRANWCGCVGRVVICRVCTPRVIHMPMLELLPCHVFRSKERGRFFNIGARELMASSNTCLLNSAYSYKGKLEEFSIPKKTKNNDAFRKKVINAFFEVPTRPYTEFPLSMFAEWYHELPFASQGVLL